MSNWSQKYGLVWYSAYEEYEILSVYKDKKLADAHCKILRDGLHKAGHDDEDFKVVPVTGDGRGWVVEVGKDI